MKGFVELIVYTDMSLLKQYLAHNIIAPSAYFGYNDDYVIGAGSDKVLFFRHNIAVNQVLENFKETKIDEVVAVRVYVNDGYHITAVDENGGYHNGELAELSAYDVFLTDMPISFVNVFSIVAVKGKLKFLQGDTTFKCPDELLKVNNFGDENTMDTDVVCGILRKLNGFGEIYNYSIQDINDEDSDSFIIQQTNAAEIFEPIYSMSEFILYDKFIAALLMLIQGIRPADRTLTPELYAVFGAGLSFSDYVRKKIYSVVDFEKTELDITEKPDNLFLQYYHALKYAFKKDCTLDNGNLFGCAIRALLSFKNPTREEFKNEFLKMISDDTLRMGIQLCFENARARAQIAELKKNNQNFLPIYFLYMFFDWEFDRVKTNLIEFDLTQMPYSNVILSLWALRQGMASVYEEYKTPGILYPCSKKTEKICFGRDYLILVDEFYKFNKVSKNDKDDAYELSGYGYFNYINAEIEYEFCAGSKKINKKIKELKNLLKKDTFTFDYVDIRNAFRKEHKVDLEQHKDEIHIRYIGKRYLQKKEQRNKKQK